MASHNGNGVKHRILWIDVCRVLFMFIVVFGHSPDVLPHHANMGTMRMLQVPFYLDSYPVGIVLMFYFFSGMLNKSGARWLDWQKFGLFMIPTILWNIICIMIRHLYPDTLVGWLGATGIIPNYQVFFPTVAPPCDYPLWFMTFLAYYSLLFPIFKKIPSWMLLAIVLLSFIVASIYAEAISQDGVPHYILRESQTFGIYLLGILASRVGVGRVTEWLEKYAWIFVAVLLPYAFAMFLPIYNKLFTNGFSAVAGVLALCSYGVVVTKCFPRMSAWIAQWAPAVFFIYAFHVPFFYLLKLCINLPELPAHTFYAYALLCYIVSILIFTYLKTNVKWIDRILFLSK
ncbi:MAG: acyltransferase [Akkermansia sp.]|nr:acyltransferase [Akkermansia sp.]